MKGIIILALLCVIVLSVVTIIRFHKLMLPIAAGWLIGGAVFVTMQILEHSS